MRDGIFAGNSFLVSKILVNFFFMCLSSSVKLAPDVQDVLAELNSGIKRDTLVTDFWIQQVLHTSRVCSSGQEAVS